MQPGYAPGAMNSARAQSGKRVISDITALRHCVFLA